MTDKNMPFKVVKLLVLIPWILMVIAATVATLPIALVMTLIVSKTYCDWKKNLIEYVALVLYTFSGLESIFRN